MAARLAAIYSLGMEVGVVTDFFTPAKQRALVYWDIPTPSVGTMETTEAAIKGTIRDHVPGATHIVLKAFSSSWNSAVTQHLEQLRWRVWEDDGVFGNPDWYSEIHDHALSDSGHDPDATTVFLATNDKKYIPLVEELRERNVRVYVIVPRDFLNFLTSSELRRAVGEKYWIEL